MNKNVLKIIEKKESAFYLFDIAELKKRIVYLKNKLPDKISLCYAVKANPFVVKELIGSVDSFEICSPGEANICRKLGVPSDQMIISGVYKSPSVIENIVSDLAFNGILTVESVSQYSMIKNLSEKYKKNIPVLLRLTNESQFGMQRSDIDSVLGEKTGSYDPALIGIQFFSGTQKNSIKKIRRELSCLDEFMKSFSDKTGRYLPRLEYGPGFPVTYFRDEEWSESDFLDSFSDCVNSLEFKGDIVLELGRSISASCGKYFTNAVDTKTTNGQEYVITDGGMHHCVYFGQHMAMKLPFVSVVGKENDSNLKKQTICGSLCSMNDILAKQIPLPEIQTGDTLCFENAGAYCMTEGISLFLSRDIPAVYLLHENGELRCVREAIPTEYFNLPKYERS